MIWVTLGLGSNSEPEANLASGLDELLLQFKDLALSNVYRSKARPARTNPAPAASGASAGGRVEEPNYSNSHASPPGGNVDAGAGGRVEERNYSNSHASPPGGNVDAGEPGIAPSGADYLNMAVGINTELPLQDLVALLKKIEDKHARDRSSTKSGRVSLDIDLLTYADKSGSFNGILLPRPEILTAAHVLGPLSQIAPRHRHPVLKQTFSELWQAFDKTSQPIAPVQFIWHERVISKAGG